MKTRERIIEAADELFYRRGFEHTSFSDIAEVAGISRGNFYHHFKTKDDILDTVILARLAATREMLETWERDREWGFPVADDQRLFEKLCLEGFQSGLSWRTILAKRENFRAAFRNFDFDQVAHFTGADVERLMQDAGIVRHRAKIEAVINNAKQAQEMVRRHGSLAAFFWGYEPDPAELGEPQSVSTSAVSIRLSKDLKKLGWKFVGPTTVYAFMQAMGLINDHARGCASRAEVDRARQAFTPPVSQSIV